MEFSDKIYLSPRERYYAYIIILILGNTEVIIKVKLLTLLLRKEWETFARNNAWNTRTTDKTLFLLDKHWNSTENEKLEKHFP